jgi:hypothetical protein
VILIDEPAQKSRAEQDEWWARCMGARISATGKVIIVESRLHESDEPGHTMTDGACDWPHLVLPP